MAAWQEGRGEIFPQASLPNGFFVSSLPSYLPTPPGTDLRNRYCAGMPPNFEIIGLAAPPPTKKYWAGKNQENNAKIANA